MRNNFKIFMLGFALFSMFFGGGNLTFPLVVGMHSEDLLLSTVGFLFSGVFLPFLGLLTMIYFDGDHEKCLNVFGKKIGSLLILLLLLFWIPLGSGPRCNLLAHGAFLQIGGNVPLWVGSAIYSILVYFLSLRRHKILDILGKIITPALVVCLLFLFIMVLLEPTGHAISAQGFNLSEFIASVMHGYNTMDFIAAIFFASTIMQLIYSNQEKKSQTLFVKKSFIIAILLLCFAYIGMIFVGKSHGAELLQVDQNKLLLAAGQIILPEQFKIVIFFLITLSVLSTSIAISLVFANYLRQTIFKDKISHPVSLFISVLISFIMSTIGFEKLGTMISYTMTVLYPILLIVTIAALAKKFFIKKEQGKLLSKQLREQDG